MHVTCGSGSSSSSSSSGGGSVGRSVLGKAAPQLICSLGNILFFINCFCCCCCCVDDGSFSGGFVRVQEELHRGGMDQVVMILLLVACQSVRPSVRLGSGLVAG